MFKIIVECLCLLISNLLSTCVLCTVTGEASVGHQQRQASVGGDAGLPHPAHIQDDAHPRPLRQPRGLAPQLGGCLPCWGHGGEP